MSVNSEYDKLILEAMNRLTDGIDGLRASMDSLTQRVVRLEANDDNRKLSTSTWVAMIAAILGPVVTVLLLHLTGK